MAAPEGQMGSKESVQYDSAASKESAQGNWLGEVLKAPVTIVRSAAYAAVGEPLRALGQVVDHCGGTHVDKAITAGLSSVGISPEEPAEFLSLKWHCQQLGAVAGMMVPLMGVRQGLKSATAAVDRASASIKGVEIAGTAGKAGAAVQSAGMVGAATEAGAVANTAGKVEQLVYGGFGDYSLRSPEFLATARKEGLFWGGAGLAYSGLLRPSNESNVGTTRFFSDRLANGLGDAAAFGVMGFTSPYIARGLESLTSSATQQASLSTGRRWLNSVLKAPVIPGAVSGLPVGVMSAEAEAWKKGDWLASKEDTIKSMYAMSFVGASMAGSHWLGAQKEGTDRTNARYLLDRAMSKGKEGEQPNQLTYRVLSEEAGLDELHAKLAKEQSAIRSGAQSGELSVAAPARADTGRNVDPQDKSAADGSECGAQIRSDAVRNLVDAQAQDKADVVVRQRLKGVLGALCGDESLGDWARPYGEARLLSLYHSKDGKLVGAIPEGRSLIATCAPLSNADAARDVFPGRTGVDNTTDPVWLSRAGGRNRLDQRKERAGAHRER